MGREWGLVQTQDVGGKKCVRGERGLLAFPHGARRRNRKNRPSLPHSL